MSHRIEDIEGIGPVLGQKLAAIGITTVEELLAMGASRRGREDMAERAGIDGKRILAFVNMADLYRIKGIGSEYSELLEAAGVDTVAELAQRRADHLCQKMAEVNAHKKLVRQMPALTMVEDWIAQARELPRIITH